MRVAPAEANTMMQFFTAHRQAARLQRAANERALTRIETIEYMSAIEQREALRPTVVAINSRLG